MKKKTVLTLIIITAILTVSLTLFIFRGYILTKVIEKAFLKAGKPIKFGTYTILIDRIEGNKLYGIKITEKSRTLEAKSGEYEYIPRENAIKFKLTDGFAQDYDPSNPYAISKLTFKQWFMKVRLKNAPPL